ncbi:enoyl-CoA hydratase/isomerase family protein [Mesorhizobium sp. M2A.F.Ca.ET.043.05.1.1]|uniref:enoyl-CoA hydratase/isomerase family protein n=1 Tax=Mesorhizobium sp. M2A.F.Ca.ET.043.05.1.1 TaxID=2493671 RepID=UPI000F74FECF|nr:enoyl-CoA hydratase/isomerase family protein [Mesorhizobium sp. M2A.F.Ca.ET.043.05.1.1]AZO18576.1 enoyl-CoA hydratase/isomerase family protein [Mesorhizobium sp. M2A.F.Ca.ET.043.05.1.1]
MSDPRLDLSFDGAVARMTIRRPQKLNALDAAMVDALVPLCRAVERSAAKVLILTGEGEKSFCAGGDVAAWSALDPAEFARHWIRDGHAGLDALARLSQPVIAVLNGHCLGGGLELAACADYRIAESHARIGLPETGLGIIPGWSGTQRTARRFGAQLIRRMSLFGEVYSADEALRLSLVDKVVGKGDGLAAAEELAAIVASRSATATELAKMLINAAEGEERERVLDAFAGRIAAGSDDLRAGLAAFREKGRRSGG